MSLGSLRECTRVPSATPCQMLPFFFSFVTSRLFQTPNTARKRRAESSSIFPLGGCLASRKHSDWTLSQKVQLTHSACVNSPDRQVEGRIPPNKLFVTAGFGACALSPDFANPLAACATALVRQPRSYPCTKQAFSRCGRYC